MNMDRFCQAEMTVRTKRDMNIIFKSKCFAVKRDDKEIQLFTHLNLNQRPDLLMEVNFMDQSREIYAGKMINKVKEQPFGYSYTVRIKD